MLFLVKNDKWRSWVNHFFDNLNYEEKRVFHSIFSEIFRGKKIEFKPDIWKLTFGRSYVQIPLTKEQLWLDWDTALSVIGHDHEIKQTYESLILSKFAPTCFLDIGANYGTHSLLFLMHGIHAISIEPNPNCKEYFDQLTRANNVEGRWIQVALGAKEGMAHLRYPTSDTWFGSISQKERPELAAYTNWKGTDVKVTTLDSLVFAQGIEHIDLIKIDTEGYETQVIQGAGETIKRQRPLIIFECNNRKSRQEIQEELSLYGYQFHALPFLPGQLSTPMTKEMFISDPASNFMAIQSEHPVLQTV